MFWHWNKLGGHTQKDRANGNSGGDGIRRGQARQNFLKVETQKQVATLVLDCVLMFYIKMFPFVATAFLQFFLPAGQQV